MKICISVVNVPLCKWCVQCYTVKMDRRKLVYFTLYYGAAHPRDAFPNQDPQPIFI